MKIIKNPDASSWNEVELLKKSQHENVIKYYGSFKCINTGHLCIVMEYCDKGTLTNYIANVRKLIIIDLKKIRKFSRFNEGKFNLDNPHTLSIYFFTLGKTATS